MAPPNLNAPPGSGPLRSSLDSASGGKPAERARETTAASTTGSGSGSNRSLGSKHSRPACSGAGSQLGSRPGTGKNTSSSLSSTGSRPASSDVNSPSASASKSSSTPGSVGRGSVYSRDSEDIERKGEEETTVRMPYKDVTDSPLYRHLDKYMKPEGATTTLYPTYMGQDCSKELEQQWKETEEYRAAKAAVEVARMAELQAKDNAGSGEDGGDGQKEEGEHDGGGVDQADETIVVIKRQRLSTPYPDNVPYWRDIAHVYHDGKDVSNPVTMPPPPQPSSATPNPSGPPAAKRSRPVTKVPAAPPGPEMRYCSREKKFKHASEFPEGNSGTRCSKCVDYALRWRKGVCCARKCKNRLSEEDVEEGVRHCTQHRGK